MLRQWQIECTSLALKKYQSGSSHFFCQATPGAGKTVFAATVASRLLEENMIDLVLCFSPSLIVSNSIKATFSHYLNRTFNGGLGSIGQSLTYHSIQFLSDEFWQTLRNHRVLVVFDEIHHCSGSDFETANVWGQQILCKIQGLAKYTLAMSGTPWRTDALPIVLSEYTDPTGQLLIDYQYTLKQAIVNNVCRTPQIVLVDSEHLSVTTDKKVESFSSIMEMMRETKVSYQSVIHNPDAMEYLLGLGCQKLEEIRKKSSTAGGLAVASSVQHAIKIKKILSEKYHQSVVIVTYRHKEPLAEIERYRHTNTQWIVSIGMISEGTDIPRLQVCCHMSAVKTELYFRQVLGRILRVNGAENQEAWLFTFAEKNLIEFSERVAVDIPESCVHVKMGAVEELAIKRQNKALKDVASIESDCDWNVKSPWTSQKDDIVIMHQGFNEFDDIQLGTFKERVISAFLD